MHRSLRRITIIMGAALALAGGQAALGAAAVHAAGPPNGPQPANVYVDDNTFTLYVMAGPGFANDIKVITEGEDHVVTDKAVTPIAGNGCHVEFVQAPSPNKIVCDGDKVKFLYVDLGDGYDHLGVRGTLFTVPTTLNGGPGNDTIEGGDGDDAINGGPGNDTMIGWWGDDQFSGGTEIDTVSYGSMPYSIHADADGAHGDDGALGLEADTIMGDVEHIIGGKGDDILAGNEAPNLLVGGPGIDVLIGDAGDDVLLGEEGYDYLFGVDRDTLRPPPDTNDTCLLGADGGEAYGCANVR